MREIKHIVLHCSATQPTATVESMIRYWRDVEHWKNPGYHFVVEANGNVRSLQPVEKPSNGVSGYNANSIHVCYIGGIDKDGKPADTRTTEQLATLKEIVVKLHRQYPSAAIKGHRDFSPDTNHNGKVDKWEWIKTCPCFDVTAWLKEENVF
ncbi:N-acetylmuramoyl-L-alanine amidase [Chitinophaga ginsengisegetis]|uniref:N-acetylmuramoyl-L-alanine amidase n=1 Tax=Chitinophaga ginsengisegetis TaxID=393003 RepID=UPI000DB9580C|nr:N-acetylmuramoyl-L-alanine amidase [Chitinophaga ginsengisegetis]MDR6565477.1 N-acetylmuramoyl-L-alanine amidase [Chitinophaga ginsengisegetis]MDR6645205.1 N-acetylmuramoyl-L-alanine amidase [Chitinophaga ginsengisegetis]MDR6652203.1 N-acetylmuramoyl-L-alanine amidase [Chitinophaga ginsengisegetis]